MNLNVNGAPMHLPPQTTIADLIRLCGMTPDKVAIEVNRRLVRSAGYGNELKEGDEIEIVTFVGGG